MKQPINPVVAGAIIVVLLALGVYFYMRGASGGSPQQLPAGEGPSHTGYSGGNSPSRPAPGGGAATK